MLSCITDTLLSQSTEMPPDRLPQRQHQRRHRVGSALPAIQAPRVLYLPSPIYIILYHTVNVVPSVPISADQPSFVGHSDRAANQPESHQRGRKSPAPEEAPEEVALLLARPSLCKSTVAPEAGDSSMPVAAVSAAANCTGGIDGGKPHRSHVPHF